MSINTVNPEGYPRTQPDTITLEDFQFDGQNGDIEGKNITLSSNMLSTLDSFMSWFPVSDFQEYSLSGRGVMPRGDLVVFGRIENKHLISAQFTIERGTQFINTNLVAHEGAIIIFKGEFISGVYGTDKGERDASYIAIHEAASIDFNEAILNPEQLVMIELEGGNMIRDEHIVTKKHRLNLSENSNFTGKLSIAEGAKLCISIDSIKGFSVLHVSGALNLENNARIDFEQAVSAYSKVLNISSGITIARAASINAELSCIRLTRTRREIGYRSNAIKPTTTKIKNMKLISVHNGENYDLILMRISSKEKK